jgi:hypothetical protein
MMKMTMITRIVIIVLALVIIIILLVVPKPNQEKVFILVSKVPIAIAKVPSLEIPAEITVAGQSRSASAEYCAHDRRSNECNASKLRAIHKNLQPCQTNLTRLAK